MKQLVYLFSFLTIGLVANAQNQEVIGSAGGYDTTSTVKVSWTVGEVVTETIQDGTPNNIVTQGFHQSKLLVTQIEEKLIVSEDYSLRIFPNPTIYTVNMEFTGENVNLNGVMYELTNAKGKILLREKVNFKTEKIDFAEYQPSIYFLRVYDEKGTFTDTYRIVKDRK